ncbi:PBECR2 nuclease fold domain-containing protein, partial [Helicobacter suis]|uniref:PBECR2 nuclease fold domain-containing protein n=1 Tax=Helicobacter suis TaxID=104628 RepID=UPI0023DD782E
FIPKFAPEVKEALEGVLHGEQIKLTQGSLYKLVKRSREELLPYIRPTLESADAIVKQVDNALIFVKDLEGKKYFTSVARNDSGEWIIASNAPKTLNNIQNKIKGGGEVLYSTLPELPIIAKSELSAKALNSEVGKAEATKPAFKNQDELTAEVQELLTKIKEDWSNKNFTHNQTDLQKALSKHLDLEKGNYSPNLSDDIKKALKHSYDQDSLSVTKDIRIDYPIHATKTLPYFKTTLENPDYLLQNLRGELSFIKKIDSDNYALVQWNRRLSSFDPKEDMPYWSLELWDKARLKGALENVNSTDKIDLEGGVTSKQIDNGQLGFSKEELSKWRLEQLERDKAHQAWVQKDIEDMVKKEALKETKAKKAKDYNQPENISWDNLYRVSTNLPINASFGKNYTTFRWNGKREKAIEGLLHLMYEKTRSSGQIAPAFYRQDLGGIDVYTQFELKGIVGTSVKDQPNKGLELFKDQPQDFLTPISQEAIIRANKDFQKWRNTHLADYITKTILEGDIKEVAHNKIILSTRDTYNNKVWDFEAKIHFSNNNDPSQPKRYMLEEFKVKEFKEKPALSRSKEETSATKTKDQEIPHNKAFGTNFKEFYHDPKGAIAKLLEAKEGQVAGAFYREDLGDIDLVWGASATDLKDLKDVKGKPLKPYGLSKIVEKHLDDFSPFEGNSAYEKLGNGLEEIVKNGE